MGVQPLARRLGLWAVRRHRNVLARVVLEVAAVGRDHHLRPGAPRLTKAASARVFGCHSATSLSWAMGNAITPLCTPAMAAGLEDHVWSIEEIVGLLEDSEARRANLKIHAKPN